MTDQLASQGLLKTILLKFAFIFYYNTILFALVYTYNQDKRNLVYFAILSLLLIVSIIIAPVPKFKSTIPSLISLSFISFIQLLDRTNVYFPLIKSIIRYIQILQTPILVFGFCLSVHTIFQNAFVFFQQRIRPLPSRFWLWLNVGISFVLSSFYAVLLYLSHNSFASHAYDYGIHDQNFYELSRLRLPPVSTVHQYHNLWLDHQHFSQLLISPLYWIDRGFNGNLIMILTPFILIFIPSILVFLAVQALNTKLNFIKKLPYWFIGFASFILFIHPYAQSALGFFFHEKYLVDLFFPLVLLFVAKFIQTHKKLYLFLAFLANVAWIGTKEDQWLFSISFFIQVIVWLWLAKKYYKIDIKNKMVAIFSGAMIIINASYSFVFLAAYKGNVATKIHLNSYAHIVPALKQFVTDWNVTELLSKFHFFYDDAVYLYKIFLTLDIYGFIVSPLSIFTNYSERIVAQNYSYRNVVFQYGSEVPLYTTIGILLLFLIIYKKMPKYAYTYITVTIISFVVGFGSLLGISNVFYVFLNTPRTLYYYNKTADERSNFEDIIKDIPPDVSLVTTPNYLPHLSARDKIINWPKSIQISEDTKGQVNPDEYDYWLLNKKLDVTADKVLQLKARGFVIIKENDFQILLKRQ